MVSREARMSPFTRRIITAPTNRSAPYCQGSGYKGHVGIYEVLRIQEDMATAISKGASTDVIRQLALEFRMVTLLGYSFEFTVEPAVGRFNGELRPMTDQPLAEEDCNKLIFSLLNNSQRKTPEQTWELDCAYGLKGVARFRVNVYRQRGTYAACLRALGNNIQQVLNF